MEKAKTKLSVNIPVLYEAGNRTGKKPIIQVKELEPDWPRYNCWRASLVESYADWLKRWRKHHLHQL